MFQRKQWEHCLFYKSGISFVEVDLVSENLTDVRNQTAMRTVP